MTSITVDAGDGKTLNVAVPEGTDPSKYSALADDALNHYNASKIGYGETFARGAANNVPLLPQAISALESGDYSQNLSDWNAKAAEAKKQNPIVYGTGAVTGSVAPLLIPGVGEALEAAPVLGNATYGAAQAISNTDLEKNPGDALKQAAIGAGIGGTIGKVGDVAGDALSSLGSKASTLSDRMESRAIAQGLDLNTLGIRKAALESGTSPEQTILDLGRQAKESIPDLVQPMDSINDKFQKVIDAHDTAGKSIGQTIDDITEGTKNQLPEAQEAINDLRNAAKNYYQVDGGDLSLAKTADKLEALQKAGKLNFDTLSKVKSAIGKGYKNPNNIPAGTDEIYSVLSKHINGAVDRLSVEHPELGPQFLKDKQTYAVTSKLIPAMMRNASREVAGPQRGLLPTLGVGALLTGHPVGAAGAALAKGAESAQELIAPDLFKNLTYNAAQDMKGIGKTVGNVASKIGNGASLSLNDYLSSKYSKDNIPVATTRNAYAPNAQGFSDGGIVGDDKSEMYQYLSKKFK